MTSRRVIVSVLVVQALCAAFFLFNIAVSVFGLPPLPWSAYEAIELGAALGLVLGSILGLFALRRTLARTARVEAQLKVATGAFYDLLEERFTEWSLTPAERDVAMFSIKGISTQEIASLRSTSEGTVKAQTNAIYRKAGVSGRPQLLSLFIEDLMDGPISQSPTQPDTTPAQVSLSTP
ncbi:MAG: helix-turn-helix transcriptional regulator [Yoonia sp.]|nr:helix-turn-helix transcriptional regulator [Flavimaricola sp.]MDG1768843.1 helix-turn-helix transcriptional regulator [Yoonia sp.]